MYRDRLIMFYREVPVFRETSSNSKFSREESLSRLSNKEIILHS
jgi:hypothetical protein